MRIIARVVATIFLGLLTLIAVTAPAHAGARDKAADLVSDAAVSVDYFANDNRYSSLWRQAENAKAIIIVPRSMRAGLIFGGSGGNGALIARSEEGWSEPTFLRISSFSFGLLAGGEVSEILLLVMTKSGLESLLASSVKLGADLSISAGSVGGGAKAQTTDILAYSRSKGLYGSISIEGSVLKVNRKWNAAFYGKAVTPMDILYRGSDANSPSTVLRASLDRLLEK